MSNPSIPNINSWLEEEMYQQYLLNRQSVEDPWKNVFDSAPANGSAKAAEGPRPAKAAEVAPPVAPVSTAAKPAAELAQSVNVTKSAEVAKQPATALGPAEQLVPLRGAAARIAENMNLSLSVPTATSQRVIAVKVVDENRRILNEYRELAGKSKLSYTHLIGWALIQAIKTYPNINNAYAESNGEPFRVVRGETNFGLAVDVAGKDGARSLLVPSIKNAGHMTFSQYLAAFDDLVSRARAGKLELKDFQGTTISLTNPGTVGTVGSVPRLMPGQGAIIATGAMDYPAEFGGVPAETKAALGLSKVMSMTCTYDHRVIQGAESGMFLGRVQELLQGKDNFYHQVFEALGVPYRLVVWEADGPAAAALPGAAPASSGPNKEAAILQLINAYRVRGHLIANLNPLGEEPHFHPELDPATYGLTIWDLDRQFNFGGLGYLTGNAAPKPVCTLREILDTLRRTYCGRMGVEYMYIGDPEQKRWLQQRMESASSAPLAQPVRERILERLLEAEMFEQFLHNRFKGHKRFSLEGGESAMAILDEVCERAAGSKVHELVIGMAHRGRLTVLANFIGKTMVQVFSEFEGNIDPDSTQGTGDVKYHLGASGVKSTLAGPEIVISVAPNPSHLEAVDPVVEGIVRAKQDRLGDKERARVIPIAIHGDAAFAGQGVVAETLNLSQLSGYTTGGTLHLVINNQIGFTTNPYEARSSTYCTDVARTIQSPIFHVNGDDPEACFRVAQIAYDFRQQFKRDAVIDMVCYRKHGHNEGDDPSYTQPVMYRIIKDHPSPATQYRDRLLRAKAITPERLEQIRKRITARLEEGFEQAHRNTQAFEVVELSSQYEPESLQLQSADTAISRSTFDRLMEGMHRFPEGFHIHEKLGKNFVHKRMEAIQGGPIDWALGEALAFASLATEGTPVRLSGQDSSRGTFSQRHLAFVDTESGREYVPIANLSPDQARFEVVDSSLSEFAVMGFEFGYSVAEPTALVMWEAQFGDFVNGAQIMIDQFISCAESKWSQPTGLMLLLPHGYEGQGPEHSSARIERFLQMCAENNMIVANCTTPAQYFHLLRRQMRGGADRRGLRKPLVLFTPKSILRHPKAISRAEEITGGTFREILGDTSAYSGDKVRRVCFCSGKIYYDLLQAREEKQAWHVAIVRVEQLYPFPEAQVLDLLARYSPDVELVWVQEEPRNMGPWRYIRERMRWLGNKPGHVIRYVGRPEAASPATGALKRHTAEQTEIVTTALGELPGLEVVPRRKRLIKRRKSQS